MAVLAIICAMFVLWPVGPSSVDNVSVRSPLHVLTSVGNIVLRVIREGYISVMSLLLCSVPAVGAVTCLTCRDQLDGCTGGANCPFLKGPSNNVAALAAGAGTVLMATSLFPREYLKVLTRSVLDTIKAVSKRALPGNVPDIRGWDIARLTAAFRDHTVPRTDIIMELTSLILGATDAERDTLKLTLDSIKLFDTMEKSSGGTSRRSGESVGVLLLMWALAGRIVERRNDTVTVFSEREETEASVATKLTEKRSLSQTAEAFCERISVFVSTCHGLGVENVLALTMFFREVAFDTMNRDKHPWQLAHMLVEVYLEDIDNSTTLSIGNIVASGGVDSRMARARTLAEEKFGQSIFRSGSNNQKPNARDDLGSDKWNGKDTPNSALGFCTSYNYGNQHPAKSLKPDGTCKYKHLCMQWVTGKGPDGCCEGKHPRKECTNPGKTNDKVRQ